jgi:acylpyruvate hydrolase
MKLATVRTSPPVSGRPRTAAARIVDGEAHLLAGFQDVGEVLAGGIQQVEAAQIAARLPLAEVSYAPVIPNPGKIICVGMNYRAHIREMGRSFPTHPTLFAKWKEALVGSGEPVWLPEETNQFDWEGELAVVVGQTIRRATTVAAGQAVAGYTLMCDMSMRDWQYRTSQWLQGKTWERSTPFGPWLATPDELQPDAELVTKVDGKPVQHGLISDLLLGPAELVSYVSTFITLRPGDVIATGTPGGVGHALQPPTYLRPGQTVTVELPGLGCLSTLVEQEPIRGHD